MKSTIKKTLFISCLLTLCAITSISAESSRQEPKPIYFQTRDNVKLAIYHYAPVTPLKNSLPLLLCPGVVCNRFFFDPMQGSSLCRYLQKKGFDVWSLEVRGHGNSFTSSGRVCPDTYIKFDIPDAINFVKSETRKKQIFWIGHSRGGALGFAHMIDNDQNDFAGAILLAPAIRFGSKTFANRLMGFGSAFRHIIFRDNMSIPFSIPLTLISYLPGRGILYRSFLYKMIFNHKNISDSMKDYFARTIVVSMPTGTMIQFLYSRMSRTQKDTGFMAYESKYSYTANPGKITRPILIVTGAMDQLITPKAITSCFQKISSKDKTHIVLSIANGFSADYGHADMLLGKHVEKEFFPVITSWILKRMKK